MSDEDKRKLEVSELPAGDSDSDADGPEKPGALDAEQNLAAFAAGRARRAAARAALEAARAGTLRMNALESPPRKAPKRLGRGVGSGTGKTAGRGHKGARSRSGARRGRVVFEGGQTPLQRRLPKRGFVSRKALTTAQIRLGAVGKLAEKLGAPEVDLEALKKNGLAPKNTTRARVFLRGEVAGKIILKGIPATAGARAAIEKAGGSVVLPAPRPAAKSKGGKKSGPKTAAKAAAKTEVKTAAKAEVKTEASPE